MPSIVENVVYQHAENVCSLWLQRQSAVDEPHYSYPDLVHLDNRVDANLEGLRVAGRHALPMIDEMIEADDEGACFAKALLALEQGQRDVVDDLVNQAEDNRQILTELASALAWARPEDLKDIVRTLLTSDKSAAIVLGLKTCAAHDRDAGNYLAMHLNSTRSLVRTAAMEVCADAGLHRHAAALLTMGKGETDEEELARGRALALLGEQQEARDVLYPLAINVSPCSTPAVNMLMQLSDVNAARSLLRTLDSAGGRDRDVVRGFGLIGDPVAMNWLI